MRWHSEAAPRSAALKICRRAARAARAASAILLLALGLSLSGIGCGKHDGGSGNAGSGSAGGKGGGNASASLRGDSLSTMTIVVCGDTAGWIVPCGCTAGQSGGLLRRASYVEQLRAAAPLGLFDAGGAAGTNASQYEKLKFRAICQGEVKMGVLAHNLGRSELALGPGTVRAIAEETGVPFVSTNTADRDGQPLASRTLVVGPPAWPIGVLGVASPQYATEEISVADARESVLRYLPELQQKCRTVLVLAYLPEVELQALAESLPEVDLVLGGPTNQSIAPRSSGPTTWGSSTSKGKFLLQLRGAVVERRAVWSGQIVEMDERFADHPDQRANLTAFYRRLEELDLPAGDSGFAPRLPSELPMDFRVAGTTSCAPCHGEIVDEWRQSAHAHAWQTLLDKQSAVDPYCQHCHTTAYGLPSGFLNRASGSDRLDVGCESCHGPSAAHLRDSRLRTPYDAADRCRQCHDQENSPAFDYNGYWARIAHGAAARSCASKLQAGD